MLIDTLFAVLLIVYTPLLLVTLGLAIARWPMSFVAFTLNACLIAFMLYWPSATSDDRLGLGGLIAIALMVGLAVVFVAGLGMLLFRPAKIQATHSDQRLALLATTPAILLLLFGLGIFSRWRGDVVFALLAACAALSLQQALWRRRTSASRPLSEDPYGFGCIVIAATSAASIAFAGLSATIVYVEAERSASGRPYCIQSAALTAHSILDLSPLTFREPRYRGDGPKFLRNHGLLVIDTGTGRGVLNWSYRNMEFLPESLADHPSPSSHPQAALKSAQDCIALHRSGTLG